MKLIEDVSRRQDPRQLKCLATLSIAELEAEVAFPFLFAKAGAEAEGPASSRNLIGTYWNILGHSSVLASEVQTDMD